jgi:hypothetical protein
MTKIFRKLMPSRIITTSIGLFILVAGLLATPIIKHQLKLLHEKQSERNLAIKKANGIGIQGYIESGIFSPEPLSNEVFNELLPYESISLQRTTCLGSCPDYKLTINRNGSAKLEVESWEFMQLKTFTGSISQRDFARLTQLAVSARRASHKSSYAGSWTDDYTVIITAESSDGKWTVSDYGQVSPIEVWTLATVMHGFRESIDWNVGPIYPLKEPS